MCNSPIKKEDLMKMKNSEYMKIRKEFFRKNPEIKNTWVT